MKTEHADIDREAAGLFTAAPGMRAWSMFCHGRVQAASAAPDGIVHATLSGDGSYEALAFAVALDTDDPATVGCMLAQVEASAPGLAVSVADRRHNLPGDSDRRFLVLVDHAEGHQTTATGPTRGAALVAAMRKLKGDG